MRGKLKCGGEGGKPALRKNFSRKFSSLKDTYYRIAS
jgi:hypothetical protein